MEKAKSHVEHMACPLYRGWCEVDRKRRGWREGRKPSCLVARASMVFPVFSDSFKSNSRASSAQAVKPKEGPPQSAASLVGSSVLRNILEKNTETGEP